MNNREEYIYADENGDAKAIVYKVFPGVEVIFILVHMPSFDFGMFGYEDNKGWVGIHYCKEGRIEQMVSNDFFYLMPTDCSIVLKETNQQDYQFPLNHYHGISIKINPYERDNPLSEYLKQSQLTISESLHHICKDSSHAILRSSAIAKQYFEDLYNIEEHQRLDYLKVKLPELFFRMKYSVIDHRYDKTRVPKTQVEFVKTVSQYILANLNEKITIKQLTKQFAVSNTYMQNAFHSVYGMPVISFIRTSKMQSAAKILLQSSCTIEELSEQFGYENESKFSAAFKKIMGETPGSYRKEHSSINIL